jgi:hypothetical protein
MCQFANCVAQDHSFTFRQRDIPTIRKRMILEILRKKAE